MLGIFRNFFPIKRSRVPQPKNIEQKERKEKEEQLAKKLAAAEFKGKRGEETYHVTSTKVVSNNDNTIWIQVIYDVSVYGRYCTTRKCTLIIPKEDLRQTE